MKTCRACEGTGENWVDEAKGLRPCEECHGCGELEYCWCCDDPIHPDESYCASCGIPERRGSYLFCEDHRKLLRIEPQEP